MVRRLLCGDGGTSGAAAGAGAGANSWNGTSLISATTGASGTFSWDGKDASGNPIGDNSYTVKAIMTSGTTQSAAATDVYGPITEASIPTANDPQTFTVGGIGKVNLTDIKSIKF